MLLQRLVHLESVVVADAVGWAGDNPARLRRSSEVAKRLVLLLRSIGPVPEQPAKARKHAGKTVLCMQLGVGVLSPHADNFCRTGERPPGLQMSCLLLSSRAGMLTAQLQRIAADCAPMSRDSGRLGRIIARVS